MKRNDTIPPIVLVGDLIPDLEGFAIDGLLAELSINNSSEIAFLDG